MRAKTFVSASARSHKIGAAMAVSVKIPTQLRAATEGESQATVDGSTVGEVLDALYERYEAEGRAPVYQGN